MSKKAQEFIVTREQVLAFITGQACTSKPVPEQDEARADKVMRALVGRNITARLAGIRFALSGYAVYVRISAAGGIELALRDGRTLEVY